MRRVDECRFSVTLGLHALSFFPSFRGVNAIFGALCNTLYGFFGTSVAHLPGLKRFNFA